MGVGTAPAVIVEELVPGALAPVKWEKAFDGPTTEFTKLIQFFPALPKFTRFWRAIPPTSDYVALGFVCVSEPEKESLPLQPPAELADRFRAVHKRALKPAVDGPTTTYVMVGNSGYMVFAIDSCYWLAGNQKPFKEDSFVLNLDKKVVVKEGDGW